MVKYFRIGFSLIAYVTKTEFASWWLLSQKTKPSQSLGEGRIYSLQPSKSDIRDLSQAVSPQTAKLGKF